MQVWVKQKAQETWQFLSSSPSPALYLFLWPSVPVSLLKEHTASLYAVSVCCCSLLYHASLPNLPWSLFTSRFAQNGQWIRRVLHLVTSSFIFGLSSPLSLHTWNQWTWNIVLGAWSATKNHPHPPLNMAPDLEDKKLTERRNCLIWASGRTSVTPMHTPGFCQAERHDNHFLLLLLESHAC